MHSTVVSYEEGKREVEEEYVTFCSGGSNASGILNIERVSHGTYVSVYVRDIQGGPLNIITLNIFPCNIRGDAGREHRGSNDPYILAIQMYSQRRVRRFLTESYTIFSFAHARVKG